MGIGVGVDTLYHALQGSARAYLDELAGAVDKHILNGGGPTHRRGELLVQISLYLLRVGDGQRVNILIARADRRMESRLLDRGTELDACRFHEGRMESATHSQR